MAKVAKDSAMARGKSENLATILWRAAGEADLAQLGDTELLDRYLACNDERAFRAVVGRHAPLVWEVCARLLRSHQDAEDAFQATFIALARRARAGDRFNVLPAWLRSVAGRAARDVRLSADRRREVAVNSITETPAREPGDPRELASVLDEEVSRLPEDLRRPFELCRFENRTYAEAARILGCSVATVCRRVDQASNGLRDRLTRRGLMPTSGIAGVVLAGSTSAQAVPPGLAMKAADVAMAVCAGTASPAVLVAAADAAIRTGGLTHLKVAGLALAAVLTGVGGLALMRSEPNGPPAAAKPAAGSSPMRGGPGDPLPQGAVVRIHANGSAPREKPTRPDGVVGVAFSADSRTVATVSSSATAPFRTWNAATGAVVATATLPTDARVHGVQPAGAGFAVLCAEPTAAVPSQWVVWDEKQGSRTMSALPDLDKIQASAMTPDGASMAAAMGDGVVILKPTNGEVLQRLEGAPASIDTLAFTADGNALIAHAKAPGGEFVVWLRSRGRWELPKPGVATTAFRTGRILAVSPDGRYVAVPCDSGYADPILVHDLSRNGNVVGWFEVGGGPFALVFSPDSRTLAATNEAASVRVWEIASGRLRRDLPGHGAKILSVAFSPDGRRLASGSADGTALIWDLDVPAGTHDDVMAVLAGPDAAAAYDAGLALAARPVDAVRGLEPLLIAAKPDDKDIARWLQALPLDDSAERRAAVEALEKHGRSVEPPIRQAFAANPPESARVELYRLVERLDGSRSPRRLLEARSLEVLERSASDAGKRLLTRISEAYPDTLAGRDAAAAVQRMTAGPRANIAK